MKYQVLIVDDEEIVCRGLAQFVKWDKYGFLVAGTACSADDALALMKTLHIDAAFMDIRMPGKSGLELLQILSRDYPKVKSVILSGFSDFSYAQEALRSGAFDYLTKPVNMGEIEEVLDRLRSEFERQHQDVEIRANRMEALLLSVAKGYAPPDVERYDFPAMQSWYGLSMALVRKTLSEEEISAKKARMKQQICAFVPGSILLEDEVFSLFAIVPFHSEGEFDSFLTILEKLCAEFDQWACGVSKYKHGLKELPDAWQEAGQALRFYRASAKREIIQYHNIETLFSRDLPSLESALPELLRRLSNPQTREDALTFLQEVLRDFLRQDLTVTQYQISCIRLLIELNGYLQELSLSETNPHAQLNRTLGTLLLCQTYQDTIDCVTGYLSWLIHLISQSDEHQLATGTIREIQLFIRQHYPENITLNSLAEQFYLHSNYLSKLFKEKTGKNFIEYLTEVRIEKAKELLTSSDYKIVEICAMCGYDNPRYLSKVFKQYTGMTPREYRGQQEDS